MQKCGEGYAVAVAGVGVGVGSGRWVVERVDEKEPPVGRARNKKRRDVQEVSSHRYLSVGVKKSECLDGMEWRQVRYGRPGLDCVLSRLVSRYWYWDYRITVIVIMICPLQRNSYLPPH